MAMMILVDFDQETECHWQPPAGWVDRDTPRPPDELVVEVLNEASGGQLARALREGVLVTRAGQSGFTTRYRVIRMEEGGMFVLTRVEYVWKER